MLNTIEQKTVQINQILKMLEALYDVVFLMENVNHRFKYVYFSESAINGASLTEDCIGKYMDEVYPKHINHYLEQMYKESVQKRKPVTFTDKMNVESMHQVGKSIIVPIIEQDEQVQYLICYTEKLNHENQVFDTLTGLPSIKGFKEKLLAMSQERPGQLLAVCYLKLEDYTSLSDLIGYDSIDDLTIELTNRIVRGLKKEDSILARMVKDEFIFCVYTDGEVCQIAADLQKQLAKPYVIDDMELSVSSSIGITYSKGQGQETDNLIRQAYHAMMQAKQKGGSSITVFNFNETSNQIMNNSILEKELRKAITKKELTLHYQPIVQPVTKAIHFEALLRWFSPTLGTIPPDVFILVAEDRNFIQTIDAWVIDQACAFIKKQSDPNLKVAVNVSTKTLETDDMECMLREAINKHQILVHQIEIEITEHSLLRHDQKMIDKLFRLKQAGFSIAIDDFGVSNASLNYLRVLPVNKVKIDKVFIHNMEKEEKEFHIVQSIISLAKKLGLTVTAEGVETKEQAQLLLRSNCDELQGYYFSKPVDESSLEAMKKQVKNQLQKL
ncbi:putative bifunctional diguanylate cyclase/phosphodiesterase [Bacillus sp. FJAT-45037]|uniref:putative bifunctional diguanylate cyclase/phosphodiesterase n=1 Tax=Bacillus sp. FJAT-45037 TaxID=2011007 RepID=UPI000C24EE7E|nr:bifunctional diguanylate cyclase/phosphodiesterase [Bacillus sp. FJAT-45037]